MLTNIKRRGMMTISMEIVVVININTEVIKTRNILSYIINIWSWLVRTKSVNMLIGAIAVRES
jgi:hypothetical protein